MYNVQARCSTNSPQDIEIIPVVKIGKILGESSKTVTLPIKNIQSTASSIHRVAVDFIETNNADIPSLIFEVKTGPKPAESVDENSN